MGKLVSLGFEPEARGESGERTFSTLRRGCWLRQCLHRSQTVTQTHVSANAISCEFKAAIPSECAQENKPRRESPGKATNN